MFETELNIVGLEFEEEALVTAPDIMILCLRLNLTLQGLNLTKKL